MLRKFIIFVIFIGFTHIHAATEGTYSTLTLTGTYIATADLTFSQNLIQSTLPVCNNDTINTLIGSFDITFSVSSFNILSVVSYADSGYVNSSNKFQGVATNASGKLYNFAIVQNKNSVGTPEDVELSNNSVVMVNYTIPPELIQTHTINIYTVKNQMATSKNTTFYLKLKFKVEGL